MSANTARRTLACVLTVLLLSGCGQAGRDRPMAASEARPVPGEAEMLRQESEPLHSQLRAAARADAPTGPAAVMAGDELWIIARDTPVSQVPAVGNATGPAPSPAPADEPPGSGAMMCRPPAAASDAELIPLPLAHTEVDAAISGYIASVTVRQQFHNPYESKIEAEYVFPLPQSAAVSDFVMTIGERRIRGIIREREEAERIYYEARAQGYVASLLTQERPNIFTQRVANIEPGKRIDVDLTYFNTLAYADGWFEFVFPMVVGPRYNPPATTDGVGAVARGAGATSEQATEVQYLAPGERSGHDIGLSLSIDAGVVLEDLVCRSHVVETTTIESAHVQVALSRRDRIPNKDFVLRYRVAGDAPKASVIAQRDGGDGYFTLMLYPPQEIRDAERGPIEMIFVLDCSGSMRGEPIAQAKRAVERALLQLEPDDTFQVIRFSNTASKLGARPLPATESNVEEGVRYVRSLVAGGGTKTMNGLRASLDFPQDGERLRFVTFMTDGYIGNEAEIIGEINRRLGRARIFSFGLGSSPNRYLMERMAKVGRGVVGYVGRNDSAVDVMDRFVERIRYAAMTDVSIDFGDMVVSDVFPARLPDLFVGRPVILTGRYAGQGTATVRINGRVGTRQLEFPIAVELDGATGSERALPRVWARMQIADLVDRATWDDDPELPDRIRTLALDYGLMSAYTAFVAVDSSRRTEGDSGTTVAVPVPVPDGVEYETTVSGGG